MTIQLSNKMQRIKPSPTLAVAARAGELKAQGRDIINMGVGEPDFDTPRNIKQAAIKAIDEGFTKYTPVDGIPALKQAIIKKFAQDNQLTYVPNQILVSTGAKQCLFVLMQALLNPGDEVIIPAPFWVSYPDMVALADGTPVIIKADIKQHFKITAAQLEKAITAKTKLFLLNSPSNPSGISYSKQELLELAKILINHPNIVIASDDIYEKNNWSHEGFNNILNVCPELYDRTIVVNGVSKTYAMTGWRIGYAAGPAALINAMKTIQSQDTSNPNSIAQKAALAAIEGDQSCINEMTHAYKQRHDFVYQQLNSMPGVQSLPSDGTFYAFPCVQEAIEKLGMKNDLEFADFLLQKAEVAVVPGSAFGLEGYMRISYAISMELLEKAMGRIKHALNS